jgi:hypothetical protein
MPPVRPILNTFRATPWIANEPVGDRTVAQRIPGLVQVAFRNAAGEKALVPLTPAAHDLLHGPTRDAGRRFFAGIASLSDARAGSKLLGVSLSLDANDFATNRMMSMVENEWLPTSTFETIRQGKRDQFMTDFQAVADSSSGARAQNVGFMDLGPELSKTAVDLIRGGAHSVGKDRLELLGQVIAHELEHSVTPPRPGMTTKGGWLEEGSAELMSWWPGRVNEVLTAIGGARPGGHNPDPWSVPQRSLPSYDYWGYLRGTQRLISLAGVEIFDENGSVNPTARARAEHIFQAADSEQLPRNVARAIGRHNQLDTRAETALHDLLKNSTGAKAEIDAIEAHVASHSGTRSSAAV